MPVRRHHLVRVVQAVRGVHGADRRPPRRQAGIDQDQRPPLGVVHVDQLGGALQDRRDVLVVAPQEGQGLLRAHQLLDLVMGDVDRAGPEREHVLVEDVVVERLQGGIAIGRPRRRGALSVMSHPCLGSFVRP